MNGFRNFVIKKLLKEDQLYGTDVTFEAERMYKKTASNVVRELKILQRANKVYEDEKDNLRLQYIEFQLLGVDGLRVGKPYWEKLVVLKNRILIYQVLRGSNQYTKAKLTSVNSIIFAVKG